MNRQPVNPWPWSLKLGYNQAEIIDGETRRLVCAGQTAVDANGEPMHPGDMRSQITLALDNLAAVLQAAGMGLADIVGLRLYTTDMDQTLQNLDVLASRMGPAGAAPPTTLVGVARLALPPMMIEIEATAAD